MRTSRILCSLFLATLGSSGFAQTWSDVVVFGDSLSDNGNFYAMTGYPPAPYWNGRFSNGPVWVEQMAVALKVDPTAMSDHAVGGATTQEVWDLQVQPYLQAQGGVVPGDAVYVVWAGANDLLAMFQDPTLDPTQVITTAMTNLGNSIGALVASGARTVIVPNLPNLALTPRVAGSNDPLLIGAALQLSLAFNGAHAAMVGAVEAGFGIDLLEVDTFALTNDIVLTPKAYDFKNVMDPAMDAAGNVVRNPEDYLFWDDIHPTRNGHLAIMARALLALGVLYGDVDGDGAVTGQDVAVLARSMGSWPQGHPADLDDNKVVDVVDLRMLLAIL